MMGKTNWLEVTPVSLGTRLFAYYAVLIPIIVALLLYSPAISQYLPMGGHDALDEGTVESIKELLSGSPEAASTAPPETANRIDHIGFVLAFTMAHLLGTIIVMLPISWTYQATRFRDGFRKGFVRSLMLLPLCATTIVLLIQNSLALAFGLAALVAAVRFRVALQDASDGIYIFAAICVGLATGIGHLGIAILMSVFFCATSTIMWANDYGKNPVDEARIARRKAKLSGGVNSDEQSSN